MRETIVEARAAEVLISRVRIDRSRAGPVSSFAMSHSNPRLPIRALLFLAALMSTVPSFDGAVLCRWSDGRVALELGSVRCADLASNDDHDGCDAHVLSTTPCGSCVDIPLGGSAPALRSAAPAAPRAIPHLQATLPGPLQGSALAAFATPAFPSPDPASTHSASHNTPLRC
jgi:hypothetical protein